MDVRGTHAWPLATATAFALWSAQALAMPSEPQLFAMLAGQLTDAVLIYEAARQYDEAIGSQANPCNALALYERAAAQPATSEAAERAVAAAKARLETLKSRPWCELRWVGPPDATRPLGRQVRAEFHPPVGARQTDRLVIVTPDPAQPALRSARAPASAPPIAAAPRGPAFAASSTPRPWPATGPAAFSGPTVVAPDEPACRNLASRVAAEEGVIALMAKLSSFVYAASDVQGKLQTMLDASERKIEAQTADPSKASQLHKVRGAQVKTVGKLTELQEKLLAKQDFIERAQLRQIALQLSASELQSGFYAEAYGTADGRALLVFRGTEFDSVPDWLSNFANFLELPFFQRLADDDSHQYRIALQVARRLMAQGFDADKVITAGHSLGGGLAAYSTMTLGLDRAYGFNPAEVGSRNVDRERRLISTHAGTADRVLNIVSSHPDLGADVVQQISAIARELVRVQLIQATRAQLYGPTMYVPIRLDMKQIEAWGDVAGGIGVGAGAIAGYGAGRAITPGPLRMLGRPVRVVATAGGMAAGGVLGHRGGQAAAAAIQLHGIERLAAAVHEQSGRYGDISCVLPAQLPMPAPTFEAASSRTRVSRVLESGVSGVVGARSAVAATRQGAASAPLGDRGSHLHSPQLSPRPAAASKSGGMPPAAPLARRAPETASSPVAPTAPVRIDVLN